MTQNDRRLADGIVNFICLYEIRFLLIQVSTKSVPRVLYDYSQALFIMTIPWTTGGLVQWRINVSLGVCPILHPTALSGEWVHTDLPNLKGFIFAGIAFDVCWNVFFLIHIAGYISFTNYWLFPLHTAAHHHGRNHQIGIRGTGKKLTVHPGSIRWHVDNIVLYMQHQFCRDWFSALPSFSSLCLQMSYAGSNLQFFYDTIILWLATNLNYFGRHSKWRMWCFECFISSPSLLGKLNCREWLGAQPCVFTN